MRIKIIDRYLIKQFLQTTLFGLLAFIIIFIIIDVMENLDDFIDQGVPYFRVLQYYLVFSPEIVRLMTPVAVLFAALFTVGKSANLSEIVAIKSSGISFFRFMMPFLITSFFISIISIYFGGFIVPMANKNKIKIEQVYLKKSMYYAQSNVFFQDSKTRIVSIGFFDSDNNRANQISIQEFSDNDLTIMKSRLDAPFLYFDDKEKHWVAENGVYREFSKEKENIEHFTKKIIYNLNFKPEDLSNKQLKVSEMNLIELKNLIETQKRAGNDPSSTLIDYHSIFAFAATNIIVVLFALPISTDKRKGGLASQVGINILVTFLYLVFVEISQAFGKNGSLSPVLTAWFANIIFLIAALINLLRAKF
ncbi:MAG: LptF/LptG family permease [Ignavibacterium sp.]|nr:LptF/LptG family permease [Ignavibacterium sp.]MDW8374870.1 LptF/LptG family permease [Ignavibacteriales bacterium]